VYDFNQLARAYAAVPVTGDLKTWHADFVVDEVMPVKPSGQGEHLWVQVEKKGCNTDWLARQLAGVAGVRPAAVGYAGMKDKHAVCRQWFSVHLPGRPDPDLAPLESAQVSVLQARRHGRKLKRGVLSGNAFRLCLRNLRGALSRLPARLETIAQEGVPNYFGEQRFGLGMRNLHKAERLFARSLGRCGKYQRGLFLSAARAWLFNLVLSARIEQGSWNRRLPGEVLMLDGSKAFFADDGTALDARLAAMDIHPSGPLWGAGTSLATQQCQDIEAAAVQACPRLLQGLREAGLAQERRALRLKVSHLRWQFTRDKTLIVEFVLPAGAFATMVLRELLQVRNRASSR